MIVDISVGDVIKSTNDYEYVLHSLLNDIAIVASYSKECSASHYEVWKIRSTPLSWRLKGSGLYRFPTTEEFGRYGWSFNCIESADKFTLLIASGISPLVALQDL